MCCHESVCVCAFVCVKDDKRVRGWRVVLTVSGLVCNTLKVLTHSHTHTHTWTRALVHTRVCAFLEGIKWTKIEDTFLLT